MEINLEKLGKKLSKEESSSILKTINEFLQNRNKSMFPGYQPVTLLRAHLSDLLSQDYLVCEKSDGITVLYVQFKDPQKNFHTFFLDRKLDFYKIELRVPANDFCVLDGELLIDKINEKEIYHYMICDCLISNKENVTSLKLTERLSKALSFVKKYEIMNNSFKISVKRMFKPYGVLEVLENRDKAHETDGLIFTSLNNPYKSGTEQSLFKWKPAFLNSVDFVIKKTNDTWLYKLFCLSPKGELTFFDYFFDITDELEPLENNYDNLIGEFRYNFNKTVIDPIDLSFSQGGWDILKIRTDKNTPNPYSVTMNVLKSIYENIDEKFFEENLRKIYDHWMERHPVKK